MVIVQITLRWIVDGDQVPCYDAQRAEALRVPRVGIQTRG